MSIVFLFFAFATIAMLACLQNATAINEVAKAWISGIAALVLFGTTTFGFGPYLLGYGNVTAKTERFTDRLEVGVAYQVISSTKDEKSQVILVKKTGTSDFYAIRVKEDVRSPEYFTLIDGQPVAIAAPTAPSGAK